MIRTSPSARGVNCLIMRLYRVERVLAPTSVPVICSHAVRMISQPSPANLIEIIILSSGEASSHEVGTRRCILFETCLSSILIFTSPRSFVRGFTSYRLMLESCPHGKNPEMAWSSDDDSKANNCSCGETRNSHHVEDRYMILLTWLLLMIAKFSLLIFCWWLLLDIGGYAFFCGTIVVQWRKGVWYKWMKNLLSFRCRSSVGGFRWTSDGFPSVILSCLLKEGNVVRSEWRTFWKSVLSRFHARKRNAVFKNVTQSCEGWICSTQISSAARYPERAFPSHFIIPAHLMVPAHLIMLTWLMRIGRESSTPNCF